MAELAIVIRETVTSLRDSVVVKRESLLFDNEDRGVGSGRDKSYLTKLWIVYIGCSLCAAASFGCGIYMVTYTLNAGLNKTGTGKITILEAICTVK